MRQVGLRFFDLALVACNGGFYPVTLPVQRENDNRFARAGKVRSSPSDCLWQLRHTRNGWLAMQ